MAIPTDLLPELTAWDHGKGVDPLSYLYTIAKSDAAVVYSSLFWPTFVVFDGYVIRDDVSVQLVRDWKKGSAATRQQVEAAVNYLGIGDLFMNEEPSELLEQRIAFLGQAVAEIYKAKLARDFPERRFIVSVIDEEDEYAVTFCQE